MRNFLLPKVKPSASKTNLEKFEQERADRETQNANQRSDAESRASSMSELTVNLVRAASEMGQLFGSVSSRDIATAVTEAGHAIDKRRVVMDKAIKTLGLFPIRVNLHSEVSITVTVNIARSLEEAETQAQLGRAVISSDQDDEDEPEMQAAEAETASSEENSAETAAEEKAEDAADEA